MPKEIADAFAKHFPSVFLGTSGTQGSEDAATLPRFNNIQIRLPYVNIEDVMAATKALKSKLSLDPDKIPPNVYKACAHLVVKPLTYIFNLSIRFSKFPSVWKISKINPIPKTAEIADITKYRLIALLPVPAKIFEAVIYKRIFFQVKTYISEYQHGFIAGSSLQSNLLNYIHSIFTALQRNLQVDAIHTDFQKAFDKVNHKILVTKLGKLVFRML